MSLLGCWAVAKGTIGRMIRLIAMSIIAVLLFLMVFVVVFSVMFLYPSI
jgi:hypothetical protein